MMKQCSSKNCSNICKRKAALYCSNTCQMDAVYEMYIERWLQGLEAGNRPANDMPSRHVHRYIRTRRGEKCWECGWCEKHPVTGKVPVQIDHIDGNPLNNALGNLRLICPNCHSLTSNWGGANRGRGRPARRRYYKPVDV